MADTIDIEKGPILGRLPFEDSEEDCDAALHRVRTAGNINMSPELFEKIYLSPQNKVSGDIRTTFANPTPL